MDRHNMKALARWSRETEMYFVTKYLGDKLEGVHWNEFMSEEELLYEKEQGLEVEYYDM